MVEALAGSVEGVRFIEPEPAGPQAVPQSEARPLRSLETPIAVLIQKRIGKQHRNLLPAVAVEQGGVPMKPERRNNRGGGKARRATSAGDAQAPATPDYWARLCARRCKYGNVARRKQSSDSRRRSRYGSAATAPVIHRRPSMIGPKTISRQWFSKRSRSMASSDASSTGKGKMSTDEPSTSIARRGRNSEAEMPGYSNVI
jgi:hypothetical protein